MVPGKFAPGRTMDVSTLEQWLWDAACEIRGPLDAPKFKDYILPLVFLKRLSDVFDDEITRLVDSLRPAVEQATRLSFRGPTRSALKSREEVRDYLLSRLQEDFPPEREEGIGAIYRLLGQPGSLAFGQAMAMASLLMVAVAAAAFLIDRVRLGRRSSGGGSGGRENSLAQTNKADLA